MLIYTLLDTTNSVENIGVFYKKPNIESLIIEITKKYPEISKNTVEIIVEGAEITKKDLEVTEDDLDTVEEDLDTAEDETEPVIHINFKDTNVKCMLISLKLDTTEWLDTLKEKLNVLIYGEANEFPVVKAMCVGPITRNVPKYIKDDIEDNYDEYTYGSATEAFEELSDPRGGAVVLNNDSTYNWYRLENVKIIK